MNCFSSPRAAGGPERNKGVAGLPSVQVSFNRHGIGLLERISETVVVFYPTVYPCFLFMLRVTQSQSVRHKTSSFSATVGIRRDILRDQAYRASLALWLVEVAST